MKEIHIDQSIPNVGVSANTVVGTILNTQAPIFLILILQHGLLIQEHQNIYVLMHPPFPLCLLFSFL